MAPLLSVHVDSSGARKALSSLVQVAQAECRQLASSTGREVRDLAKAHAPVAAVPHRAGVAPGTYRDAIVSEDGEDATRVFVDLPAAVPGNLDLWLEFGTSTMAGRPHLWPAAEAVRARYHASIAAAIQRSIDQVSR